MTTLDKEILDRLRMLLSEKVNLYKLILFGSRARGDADRFSDMDVVVVKGSIDRNIRSFISDCAWEAGFDKGIVIVPVVFSVEEWETEPERSSLLAIAVRREGIAV